MALLGEFEVAAREADPDREPDQFKLNGELFTVSDRDLTIVFAKFARAATSGLDTADMEGLAAMLDMLEGIVVDEDQPRLVNLSKRIGLDGEKLMEIIQAVIEAKTGRPTVQPSGSPAGLSTTGVSSKAPSSSAVSLTPPGDDWKDSPLGRRELAANPAMYANVRPIDQAAQNHLAQQTA